MQPPLTNLQLELLRLYALDLTEAELDEIRVLIARHFAAKATAAMDAVAEREGWTDADFHAMARGHERARRR